MKQRVPWLYPVRESSYQIWERACQIISQGTPSFVDGLSHLSYLPTAQTYSVNLFLSLATYNKGVLGVLPKMIIVASWWFYTESSNPDWVSDNLFASKNALFKQSLKLFRTGAPRVGKPSSLTTRLSEQVKRRVETSPLAFLLATYTADRACGLRLSLCPGSVFSRTHRPRIEAET